MGHKRKVSDPLSPFSVSSMLSTTSPSHYNTNASQVFSTAHSHPTSTPLALSGWGSSESPAASSKLNLNSPHQVYCRTRKRFRDNRPDEETIHQTTLSKLYAAQRHERKPEYRDHSIPLTASPTPSRPTMAITSSSTSNTTQPKPKSQLSLHAFFGSSGSGDGGQTRSTALPEPNPGSDQQSGATARCEDCSAPLFLLPSLDQHITTTDTEMMDVDIDAAIAVADFSTCSDQGSAYACAYCSRRVCDICAVRGDQRICLECANPGNGDAYAKDHGCVRLNRMGQSCGTEVGSVHGYGYGRGGGEEKRWVGGIGWM